MDAAVLCVFRSFSPCRHSAQTGAKTAQTMEMVTMISTYAKTPITTPNEPNAFPFWFSVGPIQSGEVAIVPADDERREERPGQEGAKRDLAMEQEARGPEPEDHRAGDPCRKQREQAVGSQLRRRDGHQRDRPAEGEEPDCVAQLVGRPPHMSAPGARVHVLIELSDRESPDEEADHDRERGCQQIVRGGAEQVPHESRS